MKNILFLHHFEEMWAPSVAKFGIELDEQVEKVLDFLDHTDDINEVIVTMFESWEPEVIHQPIINYCQSHGIEFSLHTYAYGMNKETDEGIDDEYKRYKEENLGKTWCYGTRDHHDNENDVLDIEDFHHKLLESEKVYLAGAFEDECVLDQEAIFDEIGVNYEKIPGLVVGDLLEYQFMGQTSYEKLKELQDLFDSKIQLNGKSCIIDLMGSEEHLAREILEDLRDDIKEIEDELIGLCMDKASDKDISADTLVILDSAMNDDEDLFEELINDMITEAEDANEHEHEHEFSM